jgi:hypothetical protein
MAGTNYTNLLADVAAANATEASSVATAASALASALATAQASYKPNDGGAYAAAVKAAYATHDAAVATATAVNDTVCKTDDQQLKTALKLQRS